MSRPAISANARALLDTIRNAEGTWHGGDQKGYGTMFGGGQFDWSKGHPDRVVNAGGYSSAAAGAYQFMPDTWRGVTRQLGMDPKDFSPDAQDRAALQLVRNRGVDPDKPLDGAALAKLAPEWASLPTASGKSYYNQPVKGRDGLLSFYSGRVGAAPNPGNGAATPPQAPAAGGGGGGGGGGFVMPPLLDLSSLMGGSGPLTTPFRSSAPKPTAALAVLAQQAEDLNTPLPSIRPRQTTPVALPRMAASSGFMQPLMALTQRQTPLA